MNERSVSFFRFVAGLGSDAPHKYKYIKQGWMELRGDLDRTWYFGDIRASYASDRFSSMRVER